MATGWKPIQPGAHAVRPGADVGRLLESAPSIDWKGIAFTHWAGSTRTIDAERLLDGREQERGRLRTQSPKAVGHGGVGERIISCSLSFGPC